MHIVVFSGLRMGCVVYPYCLPPSVLPNEIAMFDVFALTLNCKLIFTSHTPIGLSVADQKLVFTVVALKLIAVPNPLFETQPKQEADRPTAGDPKLSCEVPILTPPGALSAFVQEIVEAVSAPDPSVPVQEMLAAVSAPDPNVPPTLAFPKIAQGVPVLPMFIPEQFAPIFIVTAVAVSIDAVLILVAVSAPNVEVPLAVNDP
jgi:hypothetical protein